jgi:hypothetical protein
VNIIDLQEPNTLPHPFVDELKRHNQLFIEHNYFEHVKKDLSIQNLITEIDMYCSRNMIVGYHFTRAIADDLIREGPTIRTGDQIRSKFLADHGSLFSEAEIGIIQQEWSEYYVPSIKEIRDCRLWFNFTKTALHNRSADPLLQNYGGEQIYFCLERYPQISRKILKIGNPYIVKCRLEPKNIHTFMMYPWGSIIVSSYHVRMNSEAMQVDMDGWQSVPVPPDQMELIPYEP